MKMTIILMIVRIIVFIKSKSQKFLLQERDLKELLLKIVDLKLLKIKILVKYLLMNLKLRL